MPPFKLVASMMVGPGEEDRYLAESVGHLAEFCDEICIRRERGPQALQTWPVEVFAKLNVMEAEPSFFQHEGRARQQLLDFTLQAQPTHILAVDADEFVTDGPGLRRFLEHSRANVFTLSVQEVWKAEPDQLGIRVDGGWRPAEAPILWRVPVRQRLRINDRALACGREPTWVRNQRQRQHTGHSLLHFGWTNQPDRAARYQRYADHDGGRFHRNAHIESIMWPDDKVKLTWRGWDGVPEGYREAIMERANRGAWPIGGEVVVGDAEIGWVGSPPGEMFMSTFENVTATAYDPKDTRTLPRYVPAPQISTDDGFASKWTNPDGGWVGIRWDGTIEHGDASGS